MAKLHSLRVLSSALVGFLSVLSTACGGSQSFESTLDEMWQWDGGIEASRVITATSDGTAPKKVPAAVGVTGRGLVGRALPDGKRWEYEGEVDVLPTLVGNLVIFSGGGQVVALDVTTGKKVYAVEVHDRRLEGAGFDGTYSVLLLVDKDDAREDEILVLGRVGQEILTAKATARLGTPAAIDGVGLVPYSGQYVGALDIATGKHLGRVLVRDGLHTVSSEKGGVVLYGAGATLMNGRVTSSPDARSLKLKPRKFPGEPTWPLDGSKPRPARGMPVGIYAHVEPALDALKFSTGGYVATYYEVVVGIEHKSNEIRFSTHFPRAVAGGAAGKYGPTLCLENGAIFRVNARSGNYVPFGSLDSKVKACVVTASDERIAEGSPAPVLEQLEKTIMETGPDMVAVQRLLLRELGAADNLETTRTLLTIAQNPLVSLDLAKAAGELLRERKEGGEAMIEALEKSAPKPLSEASPKDPLPAKQPAEPGKDGSKSPPRAEGGEWTESPEDEASRLIEATESGSGRADEPAIDPGANRREKLRPPPVGALAQALGHMKTKGAARALAPYLSDPALTPKQASALMKAIDDLGTGDALELAEVSRFLYQYKNTGGETQLIAALVRAAHFLFKHGDEESREKLRRDLAQSLTHPDLAKKLAENPPPESPQTEPAKDEKQETKPTPKPKK